VASVFRRRLSGALVGSSGSEGINLDMQLDLFEEALEEVDHAPDLVHQVLVVSLDARDEISILRPVLPSRH
jgi:hypothetical protein